MNCSVCGSRCDLDDCLIIGGEVCCGLDCAEVAHDKSLVAEIMDSRDDFYPAWMFDREPISIGGFRIA